VIKVVWEFDEDDWPDRLSRAAWEAAIGGVCQHLADLRCPVHGESPTLLIRARSEDTTALVVHGCCDRLTGPARAKLAELVGGL
jgi:hypothetical protein